MKKPEFKKSSSTFTKSAHRTSSRASFSKASPSRAFSGTKKSFGSSSSQGTHTSHEDSSSKYTHDASARIPQSTPSTSRTSKPFASRSVDFKKSSSSPFYKKDAQEKVKEFKKPTANSKQQNYSLPQATDSRPRRESSDSGSPRRTLAPRDTSWGTVASWYNDHLEKTGDTYHEKVIYPNLLRIIGDIKGKKILDLACGQGQFSRLMRDKGAYVTGIDLGKELIAIAESHNLSIKETKNHKAVYLHGSADDLYMIKDATFDAVVCILALQNIENLQKTIEEAKRVLTPNGSFIFILNHPSFRNPRKTHWGYDEASDTQFRRVDEYMSESHYKIDMTPGSKTNKKFTVSFHRPLQMYVKALSKAGLAITRLEEWVSHKESEKGPRQKAENASRKELPLFMCIEAQKL